MEITTNLIDLTERKISNTYGFEFYFNNTTAFKTKPIVLNSFLPFIKKRSKFKNLQGVNFIDGYMFASNGNSILHYNNDSVKNDSVKQPLKGLILHYKNIEIIKDYFNLLDDINIYYNQIYVMIQSKNKSILVDNMLGFYNTISPLVFRNFHNINNKVVDKAQLINVIEKSKTKYDNKTYSTYFHIDKTSIETTIEDLKRDVSVETFSTPIINERGFIYGLKFDVKDILTYLKSINVKDVVIKIDSRSAKNYVVSFNDEFKFTCERLY